MYEGSKDNNDFYCNILCVRVFNEETGLLEYTLLGLVSAGVESVDIYTFIPDNEVTYSSLLGIPDRPPYIISKLIIFS